MIQSKFNLGNQADPVLALAIHNGHQMPLALERYTKISDADRFREEDPFTGQIAHHFANHIIVESSRFAVDLNRVAEKCVYLKPEDAWGLDVRNCELPEPLYNDLLQSYTDWYSTLVYQVERLLQVHPFLIVLDLHSYNHRREGPDAEADPQIDNPDIILGRSNMGKAFYPYVDDLREHLDGKVLWDRQLDVRCDVKFPGGQLARFLHQRFPGRLLCIAIEFKKIFMNEWTGKLNPVLLYAFRNIFLTETIPWIERTLEHIKQQ
jgi:hypothetical protein